MEKTKDKSNPGQEIFDLKQEAASLLEIQAVRNGYNNVKQYIKAIFNSDSDNPLIKINEKLGKDNLIESDTKEKIKEVFWLTDWKTKESIYISPSYENVYGYSSQTLKEDNESWTEHIHPEDVERVKKAYNEHAELGIYDIEFRVVHPNGDIRWIKERAFPIYDDGKIVKMAGFSTDVTDRNMAVQIRQKKDEKYHTLEFYDKGLSGVDDGDSQNFKDQILTGEDAFMVMLKFIYERHQSLADSDDTKGTWNDLIDLFFSEAES